MSESMHSIQEDRKNGALVDLFEVHISLMSSSNVVAPLHSVVGWE